MKSDSNILGMPKYLFYAIAAELICVACYYTGKSIVNDELLAAGFTFGWLVPILTIAWFLYITFFRGSSEPPKRSRQAQPIAQPKRKPVRR